MSLYLAVKHLHVGCVILSGCGFTLRFAWMLRDSALLQQRWAKLLPHINDSFLLAAAIALAVLSRQYPLEDVWLTAKVAGLIIYIVLGSVALKVGKTRRQRALAGAVALVTFVYVATVAVTKSPWGLLALIGAAGA
jgi:uncharacterized membrane protein SirB2